jgi:hypothetical protein
VEVTELGWKEGGGLVPKLEGEAWRRPSPAIYYQSRSVPSKKYLQRVAHVLAAVSEVEVNCRWNS